MMEASGLSKPTISEGNPLNLAAWQTKGSLLRQDECEAAKLAHAAGSLSRVAGSAASSRLSALSTVAALSHRGRSEQTQEHQ